MENASYQLSYTREANRNYLVVESEDKAEKGSDYQIKMIEKNQIEGLLPVYVTYENGVAQYHYDITGRFNIENLFSRGRLQSKEICKFHETLLQLVKQLNQYLLSMDRLLLSKECIYFDLETMKPEFCYYPQTGHSSEEDVKSLYKDLIGIVDYKDQIAVEMIYQLESLAMNNQFTAENIRNILYNESEKNVAEQEKKEVESLAAQVPVLSCEAEEKGFAGKALMWIVEKMPCEWKDRWKKVRKKVERERTDEVSAMSARIQEKEMVYGEVQDETEEKTCLLQQVMGKREIRFISDCVEQVPSVVITSFPSVIGKSGTLSQVQIKEGSVSRMHAKIDRDDTGAYTIEDLNSTNGTFLNGEGIAPYCQEVLADGDRIELGRAKFRIDISG